METADSDVLKLAREWPKGVPRIGRNLADRSRTSPSIRDIVNALAPILAIGGVLIYGILSLAYDEFYEVLGLNPIDVGLNYSNMLAHSVGYLLLAIASAIAIALYFLLGAIVVRPLARSAMRRGGKQTRIFAIIFQSYTSRSFGVTLITYALLALIVAPPLLIWRSLDEATTALSQSRVVHPIQVGPLKILPIYAHRVQILAIDRSKATSYRELERSFDLFLLGQANGTTIFYDANLQRVIRLPTSSVIIRTPVVERSP